MAVQSLTSALPADYGYIIIVFVVSALTTFWMGSKVVSARKKYGVKYPTMYSDKEPMFNCVQRAHQNTLEGYPIFLVLLMIGGLQYPRLCAVSGVVWILSKIVYAKGYYTGDPEKRNRGAFGYIGLLILLGCNISLAMGLIGGKL